ncbi:hypothetical protein K466DRAFT_666919 [Polyporus arcularius HHB13444]|uniref:Uncharacterized protein n=1 Tax=Polyporus arcularius HHB13444 TaxID=1314778 RepID=A0A5C3P7L2_9APHY|nr:hypothetical protein K466DRAFT_666919 [Polyporus arcularius HHB13444]
MFETPANSVLRDPGPNARTLAGPCRAVLNHHVPVFRDMARITLADWTCSLNQCAHPLEAASARSFIRSRRKLPFAWIVAQDTLRALDLSVRLTDQSYLFTGDVALRHLVRTLPSPPSSPSSHVVTNLERAGFTHLDQLAGWSSPVDVACAPHLTRLLPRATVEERLRPFSARNDWPAVSAWLERLTLHDLTLAAVGLARGEGSLGSRSPAARVEYDRDDRWSLALPRAIRRDYAESLILGAASVSSTPALPTECHNILASDASALEQHLPTRTRVRHVTFAAATSSTSLVMAISSRDKCASSLHGEVFGLIAASLLHLHSLNATSPTLYTDHLNSVRYILSQQSLPLNHFRPPSFTPAQSLYHWLSDILARSTHPPLITYTPAHTSSTTVPAKANDFVDRLASSSHAIPLLSISLPTFTLPDFVLHSTTHGYIETGLQSFLSARSAALRASSPSFRPNLTLFRHLYDDHAPPLHPYTRASSAYSATVQLYARSAQLDTAFVRYSRFGDLAPWCQAGCDAVETVHHVFVTCPAYTSLRDNARCDLMRETSEQLLAAKTTSPLKDVILRITAALFLDDPSVWPQHFTRYYLGLLPLIPLPDDMASQSLTTRRLLARVKHAWHISSIRLAGRIWGENKRRSAINTRRTPHTFYLPPHLAHLL